MDKYTKISHKTLQTHKNLYIYIHIDTYTIHQREIKGQRINQKKIKSTKNRYAQVKKQYISLYVYNYLKTANNMKNDFRYIQKKDKYTIFATKVNEPQQQRTQI